MPEKGELQHADGVLLRLTPAYLQDWKRHKVFCRQGAPVDKYAASMRQTVLDDISTKPINFADTDTYSPMVEFWAGHVWNRERLPIESPKAKTRQRKDEYSMYLRGPDGRVVEVVSNTISAAQLTEMKDKVDAEMEKIDLGQWHSTSLDKASYQSSSIKGQLGMMTLEASYSFIR